MRFTMTYPMMARPYAAELLTGAGVGRLARAAEDAGFDGFGFTDHPAPTHRWLQAGGHDALDPFAALSFVAAVTANLRLIPNIVVLPYRNPFIVAKACATLDALSGGRFTLAVGTGYLKGEYAALGVDYEARNELFDEAIAVIKGVWATDDFAFEGRSFSARGQSANPKPAHVPIWVGGNSRLSRRRVAAIGNGWAPFPAPRGMAATTKTPALETVGDLQAMLDDLWYLVEAAGRDPRSIDVVFGSPVGGAPGDAGFDATSQIAALDDLVRRGVTWATVTIPGDSIDHAVDAIGRYGDLVIGPMRG